MIYRIEDGRCEALLADGRIIPFESVEEMIACAKAQEEIFNLMGKPQKIMDELNKLLNLSQPTKILSHEILNHKKKKVRFIIDPVTEYIGNKKVLA